MPNVIDCCDTCETVVWHGLRGKPCNRDDCKGTYVRYALAPEGSVVLRPGESRKQDRDRLDTLRAQLAHAHLKINGLQKRIPPEGSVVLTKEEARSLLDGLLEKSPHLRTDKEDALLARLASEEGS